jgi:hypothetical protein
MRVLSFLITVMWAGLRAWAPETELFFRYQLACHGLPQEL